MSAILRVRNLLQKKKKNPFILLGGWAKIASTCFLCTVLFLLKYNSNLVFIHSVRWIVSPSSSRVIEFFTGRHQDCLHPVHGWPRMQRSLLSAVSSSRHLKRGLCMRSRSVLISTSFKAWTVNPERLVRLRKVWRRRTHWIFVDSK